MKMLVLMFFIGYCTLLYPQFEGVFVTEPEVDYDLYYRTCDELIDSVTVFFAGRINHIPKDYEKGVKIFFTADKNGKVKDVEFEEDSRNKFDTELSGFLKGFKFNNPVIRYIRGDAFNVRMSIAFEYTIDTERLDVAIDHYSYWMDEYPVNKDLDIRRLKPQYNKEDTIAFYIINNNEKPLLYYIRVEGKMSGLNNWIDSSEWGSSISQDSGQLNVLEGKDTISIKLLAKDIYVPDVSCRFVVNNGFKPSVMDKKVYSYIFKVSHNINVPQLY